MGDIRRVTGMIKKPIRDEFGDIVGYFKFSPSDLNQYSKMQELLQELPIVQAEYDKKISESTEEDAPKLMLEACIYLRSKIDYIYGEGASDSVFGNVNEIEMFAPFFEDILPDYHKASEEKMKKYNASKN